jgi:hypothetical protein
MGIPERKRTRLLVAWLGQLTCGALVLAGLGGMHTPPAGARAPAAATTTPTPTPVGQLTDFVSPPNWVRFGGVFFVGRAAPDPDGPLPLGRGLEEADLGPEVGRVTAQVQDRSGLVGPCPLAGLPDGGATFLPVDSPLYAVKGYATSFRLAARWDGRLRLFEAVCGEHAKVGADLLDVAGRVERVSVYDGRGTEVATFDDPVAVERLVGLVLAAPVDPALLEPGLPPLLGEGFFLILLLADGTSAPREMGPYRDGMLLRPGVVLPPEFRAVLAEAGGDAFWPGPPPATPTA